MVVFTILLALLWMALNGSYTLADLVVGLLFGFLVIRASWRVLRPTPFRWGDYLRLPKRPLLLAWRWLRFLGFGFVEIVKSNIAVARVVLAPKLRLNPGIVAIPLDVESDAGITTLANLVTLTPGTVSLDISTDRRTLYIHAFSVDDADALREETKASFERRVKELLP